MGRKQRGRSASEFSHCVQKLRLASVKICGWWWACVRAAFTKVALQVTSPIWPNTPVHATTRSFVFSFLIAFFRVILNEDVCWEICGFIAEYDAWDCLGDEIQCGKGIRKTFFFLLFFGAQITAEDVCNRNKPDVY